MEARVVKGEGERHGAQAIVRTFAFAWVLRPSEPARRASWERRGTEEIAAEARREPSCWQALLMKRSYGQGEWDSFGGLAERGEEPEATLRREFAEETGVEAGEIHGVGTLERPYRGARLVGHGFVVAPTVEGWMREPREWAECDPSEVAEAAWFDLAVPHDGEPFLRVLGARARAFLAKDAQADVLAYLDRVGLARCVAQGDFLPAARS